MNDKFDQAKGRVEQAAGDIADDDEMKKQGKIDETSGKLKEKLDQAKDKIEEVIDEAKDKLKKH